MSDLEKKSEEDAPQWGAGSIKQKILQWESLENISNTGSKLQTVKQRAKLTSKTFQQPEPSSSQPNQSPKQHEQIQDPVKKKPAKIKTQQLEESLQQLPSDESASERQMAKERLKQSKVQVKRQKSRESVNSNATERSEETVVKTRETLHKTKDRVHKSAGDSPRKSRTKRQQSVDLVQQTDGKESGLLQEKKEQHFAKVAEQQSNVSEYVPELSLMMKKKRGTSSKKEIPLDDVSTSNKPPHIATKVDTNQENYLILQNDYDIDVDTAEDWFLVEEADTREEEEEITTDSWSIKSRKVEYLEDEKVEVEIAFKPETSEVSTTHPELSVTHALKYEEANGSDQTIDKEIDVESSKYNDGYDSENSSVETYVPETEMRDYRKIRGHATMKAEPYDVKLAALLYLRGINSKQEFFLASSVDGAGAFDNIVLKYKSKNIEEKPVWKTCFIQIRNKENTTITPESLISPDGDFSLKKDFKSYCDIKEKMSKYSDEKLFNNSFDECSFILYTNAKVSEKLALRLRKKSGDDIEKLLKSGLNDELMFTFSEESDKDIFVALGSEKKDFLKKLKVFSGQPSEIDLDHWIKMELRAACTNYLSNVHIIYRFYIEAVQQWWTDDHHFLTQKINILDKAETILNVYNLSITQKQLYRLQDVTFKESTLAQWQNEIRKNNPLMCIVTTNTTTKFSSTKLMQILWEENIEYIFTSLKSLLQHAGEVITEWTNGEKDLLVIVSEVSEEHEDICEDICEDLCNVFKKKPHKQLIILSSPSDSFTTNLQLKYGSAYENLYDPFDLLQLDKESTDQILEKEIKFQGCPIYLRCISGDDIEKISQVLTSENFDQIVDNAILNIGDDIDGYFEDYKQRTFERSDVIKQNILTEGDFRGVLAISNITVDELETLVPQGDKVGLANDPNTSGYKYLVLDSQVPEDDYYNLCKTREDVHWIHMTDTLLLWKRSQRNITSLVEYIEDQSTTYQPEHILDLDDRVVLVVAESKTGKTFLTKRLAKETKVADPSLWVIKLHLQEHIALLESISSDELNAVDFLSAVGIDNANSEFLARDLLRHSIEELGNVAVFIDGFDDIVPQYLRKALTLLKSLLQSKIKKIFVTSQYAMKDMLESNLSTMAYKMCPLEFNKDDDTSEHFV